MTADQFRAARAKLGLSSAKLAQLLRMGHWGGRTIRRWEAGHSPISGPAAVAVEAMLAGYQPKEVNGHE